MSNTSQELEIKKNDFYRDSYRITIKWLVRMLVVTLILSGVLMWMTLDTKQPAYYAAVTNGDIVPLHSLSEPVLTNDFIVRWAALATSKLFNLSFDNYQTQLAAVKDRFTTTGWQKMQQAFKASGFLDNIINNKLIMSAVLSGSPVVLAQMVVNGRLTWRVQMPLLVNFTSASEQRQESLIVTMNIRRISTLSAAQGIQISDFQASKPV